MSTITIKLPDERFSQLKGKAVQLGVSPEDLVLISIEELLTRPDEEFEKTVDYVLQKNAELYQRLA